MYRRLGFFRDPFSSDLDDALYHESRERRERRAEAQTVLGAGKGLWIEGPPGAGKSAFANHLAATLAEAGRPVLYASGPSPETARGYLEALFRVSVGGEIPADVERLAEALYARILRTFWKRGTVVVWVGEGIFGESALREVEGLAQLRVKGQPLALPILCGSGPPPFQGIESVELASLSRDDISRCLLHRALMCGNRDALPPSSLQAAVRTAAGIGEALRFARAEMLRIALLKGEDSVSYAASPTKAHLFDEREVSEVGRLLASISSGCDDD